jgi:hypothetical protein
MIFSNRSKIRIKFCVFYALLEMFNKYFFFFFAPFYNIEAKNEPQVLIKRKKSFDVLFGKPSPEY